MVSIFIAIFEHTEVFPWRILEVEPRDIGHKLLKIPVPSDSNTITISPISVPQRLISWGLCIHPWTKKEISFGQPPLLERPQSKLSCPWALLEAHSGHQTSFLLTISVDSSPLESRPDLSPQSGVSLIQVSYWPLHL